MIHIPVLLQEVLFYLDPKQGDNFIDGTTGGGGHTKALAKIVGKRGKILAIDRDPSVIKNLVRSETIIPIHGNFAELYKIVQESNVTDISGTLFDFGFSSIQLKESARGFSFADSSSEEPLDMRFDTTDESIYTASQILAKYTELELAKVFSEYGEERYAKRIAHYIKETRKERPISTVGDLVERIREITPIKAQHARIHFATRIFQALRIETNNELENIQKGLNQALDVLVDYGAPKARIVAISFHSLEDRIVKHTFRAWGKVGKVNVLTKKPIRPGNQEIQTNPRARSAKLRAVEII